MNNQPPNVSLTKFGHWMYSDLKEFMDESGYWYKTIRGEDGFTFLSGPDGSRYAYSFVKGWEAGRKALDTE